MINVKARTVTVFRQPEVLNYATRLELSQGTISPLAFTDVEIPIEKIFSGEILD